jgi:hypothetical protein
MRNGVGHAAQRAFDAVHSTAPNNDQIRLLMLSDVQQRVYRVADDGVPLSADATEPHARHGFVDDLLSKRI